MTDTPAPASAPAASGAPGDSAPKPRRRGFQFTDPGCRLDVRLGLLLLCAGVFLWNFVGPTWAVKVTLAGCLLLLIGIPLQAIQARRIGRPGFPSKVGIVLAAFALILWWQGVTYRESPPNHGAQDPLHVHISFLFITGSAVWMLAWWPIARLRAPREADSDAL